jgi:cytochrome c553
MKHTLATAVFLTSLAAFGMAQAAGNASAGKTQANGCAGCHGANGEGKGAFPALAGKSEDDFVQAMKDYKSGTRVNPVMKNMSAKLSDGDMANLAAYYASLKPK